MCYIFTPPTAELHTLQYTTHFHLSYYVLNMFSICITFVVNMFEMQHIQRKIFFLIGFTAVTISSLIEMLQVTHTSWILSMGINDAAPAGLYRSQHHISTV